TAGSASTAPSVSATATAVSAAQTAAMLGREDREGELPQGERLVTLRADCHLVLSLHQILHHCEVGGGLVYWRDRLERPRAALDVGPRVDIQLNGRRVVRRDDCGHHE